jgi:hypothetical protein
VVPVAALLLVPAVTWLLEAEVAIRLVALIDVPADKEIAPLVPVELAVPVDPVLDRTCDCELVVKVSTVIEPAAVKEILAPLPAAPAAPALDDPLPLANDTEELLIEPVEIEPPDTTVTEPPAPAVPVSWVVPETVFNDWEVE